MLERISDIISLGTIHRVKAKLLKQDSLGIVYFDAHNWHKGKSAANLFHQDSDHIADT
jgi:hypothetical protein